MNLRNEWKSDVAEDVLNSFYTKEETVNEVIENFDVRRKYSAEGEELVINGITDWCLVQTSSNPLKELDDLRKIFCPLTMSVRRGDYVEYDNSIWLIDTNVVNVGNAYWSTRISRCSYILKWQDEKGNIISRHILSYNASAYNNGIAGNSTVKIGSDQLMIMLPFDDDTKRVKRGKKFFIDNNMEDPMVYELTRPDRTTYVFNGVGYINWLVTECQYTPTSEDLLFEVCNYHSPTITPTPPDETTDLYVHITYTGSDTIRIGGNKKTFTATMTDSHGENVELNAVWSVNEMDGLYINTYGNTITISCDNEALDGEIITISAKDVHSGFANTITVNLSVF